MQTRSVPLVCCLGLIALACSEEASPVTSAGGAGGAGGAGANHSMAGTGTQSVAGAGSSNGGSSGAGGGSGGVPATGDCPLQGDYTANAELKLPKNDCGTPGGFKTIYNINITGRVISIEQYVEKVPMLGSIDGACNAEIVVEAPTYREFQLAFVPASLTASGTYVDANSSNCRSTYEASLKLTAE